MATRHLDLAGCTPRPLASYLKALGVLRLVSSRTNNVSGEAADPHARGWWKDDRFHVRTNLGFDGLERFLLHEYAPSPIVAPWNGGSGFYPKDNKDGFSPLVGNGVAERFRNLSVVIRCASRTIAELGLIAKPDAEAKVGLVARLRSELPEFALDWVDAVLALSGGGLAYPELLGTGGNDGRLDFTNNFLRRLVAGGKSAGLFDASTGEPARDALPLLRSALRGVATQGLRAATGGQFSPGAGGANATTGYTSASEVNPWDFVLLLEGSAAFAGAATRRHERAGLGGTGGTTTRSGASFPFTVKTVGAGWGGVAAADEDVARAEFWAPLWTRPARFCEVASLLGEGRAVLNGRTARDGLEFARAASSLGVSRGFREFERFGFLMRAGKAHLAASLGRRSATPSSGAEMIADLDVGGWLDRVRRVARDKEAAGTARRVIGRFEEALFELVADEPTSAGVARVLVALGRVVGWLSTSSIGRKAVGAPPPLLSSRWVRLADDGSAEFRVAAALAGLGIPDRDAALGRHLADSGDASRPNLSAPPPMAAHFAPLEEKEFVYGGRLRNRRAWSTGGTSATMVWGAGPLVPNLIAVLERRLVEASMRGLADKPLAGAATAGLADVAAFLAGDFDDACCAGLLAGLVWGHPRRLSSGGGRYDLSRVPFAYAALKPAFAADEALHRCRVLPTEAGLPIPQGVVARLRAGGGRVDGRVTDAAVRAAMARARASGVPTPFDASPFGSGRTRFESRLVGVGVPADRLAAALLIPVGDLALARLIERAYPGAMPEDNNTTAEDFTHAN